MIHPMIASEHRTMLFTASINQRIHNFVRFNVRYYTKYSSFDLIALFYLAEKKLVLK